MAYKLPSLPYSYDALEPFIDKATMEIHHTKHHKLYVDNLNKALIDYPKLSKLDIDELIKRLNKVPSKIRNLVRNHGGGHANHSFFWKIMRPVPTTISGKTLEAIKTNFTDFDSFKDKFTNVAMTRFGSGWGWLAVNKSKKMVIYSTPNQDSPLTKGDVPILGIDVWEHAYYLKYQNRRADYIKAWWNVVNWQEVEKRYRSALRT